MEQSPKAFYKSRISGYTNALQLVRKRLFLIGMLRLAIFLATVVLIYFFIDQSNIAIVSGIIGMVIFLYAISKNTDAKLEKRRLEKLIALNQLEIKILNREMEGVDTGDDFVGEDHFYNQDIDLFGLGSIFQFINRTATKQGRSELASILNSNNIENISEKQEAIKQLSVLPDWRQNFQTTAALVETKVENTTILNWLKGYKTVVPSVFKWLPLFFSGFSILSFVCYGVGWITGEVLTVWFFVGIAIVGVYFKRVTTLYHSAGKMTDTFAQYAKLLLEIEKQDFDSKLLVDLKENIKTEGKKASEIFGALSKELNNLDQRNNFLFAFIANGFFLWDLRYAYRVEEWIKKYGNVTDKWFKTISGFDAYNSLGNYAHNYPTHVYPKLSQDASVIMNSTALGHPLLTDDQRVLNDFNIKREDFFIITGANMAGKSTFLRTVALNLVLANSGLPICAATFEYTPIKLISSMRTSDSLLNDESYFFSELKRLKFIVDEIKTDTYFIILDEILKGTNSKDKEEGSKKFVEKLVSTNSTGIIATHDLSLCELSKTFPEVKNRYFDAEIINDELFFDYRFKQGICQNMNASFLLRKMEIV